MKNCQTIGKRKVVFYGRVSTEHEAQTYALCNQMQWYEELKKSYPNWVVVERYVDDGITGTQAKKRPEFMRMIEDAKSGKFDLIVTREVARFARNTIDCLEVTRQLKNYGVEVFFVQDGIRTLDNEGEMILTIRAMVAQEESRKMSERIKAGQAISRKNGVLYGNGNLLGYDRVGDTYIINEDQAETVRMIFNMYESGFGLQMIRDELIKRERKNSSGLVKWDNTRIIRCLHNSAYKGVVAYNKSHRNNYLEQKVVVNHNENTFEYTSANFEPIICKEQAYLLLRGYHLIAHTQNNEQLYLMQQARIKWLSYSSRIQWEQFIEKYFSKDYDGIRLYENMDGLVQVSTKNIPVRNREEVYSSNLNEHKSSTNNLSFATEEKLQLYIIQSSLHLNKSRVTIIEIGKS